MNNVSLVQLSFAVLKLNGKLEDWQILEIVRKNRLMRTSRGRTVFVDLNALKQFVPRRDMPV